MSSSLTPIRKQKKHKETTNSVSPSNDVTITDVSPDEKLFAISTKNSTPWYADIVNYLVSKHVPAHWNRQSKTRFFSEIKHYFWEEPELFKIGPDQIIRRCVPEVEHQSILEFCHSKLVVDTSEDRKQPTRCSSQDFTGHRYSRMLMNIKKHAPDANK
jgi:hypothetical protein